MEKVFFPYIESMDGFEFENLISKLLVKMGFEVEETKQTADGGVDVIARSHKPISGGLYIVQCKRQMANVGEPVIRDLYGVVGHNNASKGILITTADYTRQATQFAKNKPLELMNGDQLRLLLINHGMIDKSQEEGKIYLLSESMRKFCRGLNSIKKKTDAVIEKDKVIEFYGTRDCTFPDFLNWIVKSNLMDTISSAMQALAIVCQQTVAEANTGIPNEVVKARLSSIQEQISIMLRIRTNIRDKRLEEPYVELKRAILKVIDSTLQQISDFWGKIVKLLDWDGKVSTNDPHIKIEFSPDISQELEHATSVMESSTKLFEDQKKKQGCFIATTVYGNTMDIRVQQLRKYRDYILIRAYYGRLLIASYYHIGPFLSRVIGKIPFLKSLFKIICDLFLRLAIKKINKHEVSMYSINQECKND